MQIVFLKLKMFSGIDILCCINYVWDMVSETLEVWYENAK